MPLKVNLDREALDDEALLQQFQREVWVACVAPQPPQAGLKSASVAQGR
jgi:hypothetical protein